MAELSPIAVITELMNPDGTMCRHKDIEKNLALNGIPIITINQIIEYEEKIYTLPISPMIDVECDLVVNLDNPINIKVKLYRNDFTKEEVCLLKFGGIGNSTYVRIHSECFTGNVLHSLHCDCQEQLVETLKLINKSSGLILYMIGHEGRGIGLFSKLQAYKLQQEQKLDTIEANEKLGLPIDSRNYQLAIRILKELSVKKIKLVTNNPNKYKVVSTHFPTEMISIPSQVNEFNKKYLETKKIRMNHF